MSEAFRQQIQVVAPPEKVFPYVTESDLLLVWMGDHANNAIKSRPWTAQGEASPSARTQRIASATTVAAGHAFVQNLRRSHYAINVVVAIRDRIRVAFDDLALSL